MSDDMNTEKGDSGNRPEKDRSQESLTNKPRQVGAPEGKLFPEDMQATGGLRLAPETLSSVPTAPIEDSTHPISRLRNAFMAVRDTGGAQRAGTQGRAGGTTAEGRRPPHRGIGRRGFILGSAAIAVTAAALQEPRTGLIQRAVKALFGGGKKDGETNSVASDPTKSDAGQPPARYTEAPTKEAPINTPEPTPTNTPEPQSPEYGKYKTVEEAPFSNERKRAIQELTEGCVPQIITDHGMLVLPKGLITRPEKIMYDVPNGDHLVSASQLHSVRLNTVSYPNAAEMFDRALERAKFEAWKKQSKSKDATFEEYLSSKGSKSHPFDVWGYIGATDQKQWQTLDDDTFIIIKPVADAKRTDIIGSVGIEYAEEVSGGVMALNIFKQNFGGIGFVDRYGNDYSKYAFAFDVESALASLGADGHRNIVSGQYSLAGEGSLLGGAAKSIIKLLIPQHNYPEDPSTADYDSIFTVTGTKIQR